MEKKTGREKEVIKQVDAELDPFEIDFLPEFLVDRGPRKPFVNQYDVVIGDHDYESEQSPLNHWSIDTDPSVMAGDEWVHPFKDIGFHTAENKDYFEQGIVPQAGIFMHPDKDVAYEAFNQEVGGAIGDDNQDSQDNLNDKRGTDAEEKL